jgi:hypothetical protein
MTRMSYARVAHRWVRPRDRRYRKLVSGRVEISGTTARRDAGLSFLSCLRADGYEDAHLSRTRGTRSAAAVPPGRNRRFGA